MARMQRKVVDALDVIRCVAGPGLIREEVWQAANGEVTRYNLALICNGLFQKDNGRSLATTTATACTIGIIEALSRRTRSRPTKKY